MYKETGGGKGGLKSLGKVYFTRTVTICTMDGEQNFTSRDLLDRYYSLYLTTEF